MYSTPQDVRTALTPGGQQSDLSTGASLADEQINDAIAQADTIIDSYLGLLYVIPTSEVPVEGSEPPTTVTVAPFPVRYFSRDIAAWLATLTFKRNQDIPPDDPIRLRYNMTMNLLQRYSDGTAVLPNPPFTAPGGGADSDVGVYNLYDTALFGQDIGREYSERSFQSYVRGY